MDPQEESIVCTATPLEKTEIGPPLVATQPASAADEKTGSCRHTATRLHTTEKAGILFQNQSNYCQPAALGKRENYIQQMYHLSSSMYTGLLLMVKFEFKNMKSSGMF